MLANILRLWRVTHLFSNIFVVWTRVFNNFSATLRALKPDIAYITSFRSVVCIEHTAAAAFVALWLVLPCTEWKNFR